jgi:cobalamin transport system substrate-binding protein
MIALNIGGKYNPSPLSRRISCLAGSARNFKLMWLLSALILSWFYFPNDLEARTVTDQLGRSIQVPDTPRRVVSLAPNITEIIFSIQKQDLLVGVSRFSDFPEAAREIPKVGSYIQLDLERIVALRPDLCIAIKDGNPREVARRLEDLGIPVYAVNPQSLATVLETVSEIGSLLNAEDQADHLVAQLRGRIHHIDQLVGKTTYRPRVFFQIGISPIVSAGADTFIHELVERAGGINLAGTQTGYPQFSREQVLELAPEVIIITSMARGALFEEVRSEWLKWKSMPAARDERIYIQESNLFDRPSPRLVEGLELLTRLIHPELFEDSP